MSIHLQHRTRAMLPTAAPGSRTRTPDGLYASERIAHAATEAIAAINANDLTWFLECFHDDATLRSDGSRIAGVGAIATWAYDNLIGPKTSWDSVILLGEPPVIAARTRWRTNTSTEARTLEFTLQDGLIADLAISQ